MTPPALRFTVLAVALSALLTGCRGTHAPPVSLEAVPATELRRAKSNVRVFDAAWSCIADEYYDRTLRGVDWDAAGRKYGPQAAAAADDRALYDVLNEMLGLLGDRHTFARTPAEAAERQSRTSTRIGLAVGSVDGKWVVTEVVSPSPAESAGVKPGWILVAHNGRPVEDESGPLPQEGQIDTWDFLDEKDQPRRLSIPMQTLSTRPVHHVRVLPSGIVVVRFDEFDSSEQRWLDAQIEAHQAAPALVLDLRRNRGGELDSLVAAIGLFFDDPSACGRLVTRRGGRIERSTRPCKTAHYRGPMAVLVDRTTASAAEILAAVLQEQKRATIVGRKTRGAVLGSGDIPLPDGGEIQVSGLDYATPGGRRLDGEGVVPDVETPFTLADFRTGADPDLDAALRVLGVARVRR